MKYVYPVVSRRSKGLSVGINLTLNNACNLRCIYCQVPKLVRGKAPQIDTEHLEDELDMMLEDIVRGDFMNRFVSPEAQRLNDIALSGNGEPTASPQLLETIDIIADLLGEYHLLGAIKVILITNGTLIDKPIVQDALSRLSEMNGEVWFKLDSVTQQGLSQINSLNIDPSRHLDRLKQSSQLCPTWIQTCLFARNGQPPLDSEQKAFLDCLSSLVQERVPVRGVLLYGLARASCQPEAAELSVLPEQWMENFAQQIKATGLPVELSQ